MRKSLAELAATKAWAKLSAPEQVNLTERLDALAGTVTTSEKEMADALGPLPAAIAAEVWKHVAVSHPEGVLQSKKGQPLPDAELREQESVPLPAGTPVWDEADVSAAKRLADAEHRAAVDAYIGAEVLP